MVSGLTPAEILIAARRLAGARPHLAAVAGIVHPEDLWQLCREELTGAEVRVEGYARVSTTEQSLDRQFGASGGCGAYRRRASGCAASVLARPPADDHAVDRSIS